MAPRPVAETRAILARTPAMRLRPSSLFVAALAVLPGAHVACADEPPPGQPPVPVLVELFTSEGCSSCPPAEEELTRLAHDQPVAGARIVPVAFHVDYWNELGWPDPFSAPRWTNRQREYDPSHGGHLYTPQAVVHGGRDCVGSDDRSLRGLVRDAARTGTPAAHVTVTRGRETDALHVSVGVGALPPVSPGDQAELQLVLVEHDVVVDVPRGENAGKRLQHAPLAREVANRGVVAPAGGTFEAAFAVPSASRAEKLGVVAMVRERSSHRVLGVGFIDPSP
jgi:hypothetical protein